MLARPTVLRRLIARSSLCFVSLYLASCASVPPVTVPLTGFPMQIQTDDPDQIGQLISIDGKIAGRMNDFVRVTEGTHTIRLFTSYLSSFIAYRQFSVDVSTERIAIRNVYTTPLEVCSANKRFKVELAHPLTDTVTTQNVPRITFSRPDLVPIGPTLCNADTSWLGPKIEAAAAAGAGYSTGFWNWFDHTSLKVMFSSDPDGAEILVDGKGVGQTNAELEFPYRRSAPRTLSVVVRKSGYINCGWSIELPGESATNRAFRCPLVPIRH